MRPVAKGLSPVDGDFNNYKDAKAELVSRLGLYCSYCERRIATNLAVEHIQPQKGPNGKPELKNSWLNFLLGCVNCNSTKSKKAVNFTLMLFPDRDNTFAAYQYEDDGTIAVDDNLTEQQHLCATNTLALLGLDKPKQVHRDSNDQFVALDRSAQRMEIITTAQSSLQLFLDSGQSELMQQSITQTALGYGHFSLWMKVFTDYPQMKLRFIQAFAGTENSGCFEMHTANNISPAPNPDNLESGSKV